MLIESMKRNALEIIVEETKNKAKKMIGTP